MICLHFIALWLLGTVMVHKRHTGTALPPSLLFSLCPDYIITIWKVASRRQVYFIWVAEQRDLKRESFHHVTPECVFNASNAVRH